MDVKLELGPAGQDYDHIEPLDSKAGMSDLFRAHKKGLARQRPGTKRRRETPCGKCAKSGRWP